MIKQCPRCKNEDINENQNYCQICGLDLRKGTAPEVPVQEQYKEIVIKSKNVKTPAEVQADLRKILYQLG